MQRTGNDDWDNTSQKKDTPKHSDLDLIHWAVGKFGVSLMCLVCAYAHQERSLKIKALSAYTLAIVGMSE